MLGRSLEVARVDEDSGSGVVSKGRRERVARQLLVSRSREQGQQTCSILVEAWERYIDQGWVVRAFRRVEGILEGGREGGRAGERAGERGFPTVGGGRGYRATSHDQPGRQRRDRFIADIAPVPTPRRGHCARSGQRSCIGRYGGAPKAAGWGEDCWTGPPILGAIRVTAPILRRVHSHAHQSRSATGTESGTECHGLSGGPESVQG